MVVREQNRSAARCLCVHELDEACLTCLIKTRERLIE
jgi:hypothetical protein